MCNLHSITTNQEATRHLARVMVDNTGNMQPLRTAFSCRLRGLRSIGVATDGFGSHTGDTCRGLAP